MCIIQKLYALLGLIFIKFEKRGTFMGPNFFGTFFVKNMGKIVSHGKDRSFFCNLSEKFRLYRYTFNTVKSVFVDLKKN